jgi:MarR family transcriptional regulator, protease production regulatory protein HPr
MFIDNRKVGEFWMDESQISMKDALLFTQRIGQLSKALWKAIEKDWQNWIKPYDLNINEHHILWIAYQLNGASISDVANFGVMHVSTAFNFSKKLEERGLLEFSKKENDKRNTYICLTDKGKKVFVQIMEEYNPSNSSALSASLPIKNLYGKFPELLDIMTIVKHIYGDNFIEIFEKSFTNLDDILEEDEGHLKQKEPVFTK